MLYLAHAILTGNMKKIWEHLRAASKHWVWLMSGVVSVVLTLFERIHGFGVPTWVFWIISALCFFVALHLAWLDKDRELQSALGPAPEVVLEYECSKRNPLTLRNLRGWTAYHVKIEDVVISSQWESSPDIADRCIATFEEVSHLPEGTSVRVLPLVQDRFVNPDSAEWKDIKDDFAHVLERAFETWGRNFHPIHFKMFVSYADGNERKYRTECNVEFDRFKGTAKLTCEPPRPIV
jgi:hypothetical protein